MPKYEDITWAGLDFTADKFSGIMDINRDGALAEAEALKEYYASFGDALPQELESQRQAMADRASAAPEVWKITDAA